MNREVLVVIGVGGIGQAIARRQGSGREALMVSVHESCQRNHQKKEEEETWNTNA